MVGDGVIGVLNILWFRGPVQLIRFVKTQGLQVPFEFEFVFFR